MTTVKCPKCGDDVILTTACGVCGKCSLMVFGNGETLPMPQTVHHNYPCDMVRGPCCCGGWHDEKDQIEKARSQAP